MRSRACAPCARPAPTSSCSATPTAAACRARSAPASKPRRARGCARRSAFTATTTASSRSPTRSPRSRAGAVQVQGTINGFGERCGNANLFSVIAEPAAQARLRVRERRAAASSSRRCRAPSTSSPTSSRTSASRTSARARSRTRAACTSRPCRRTRETYEHIDPELVGNRQRVLVSDLSGRSNVVYKAKEFGLDLDTANPAVKSRARPREGAGERTATNSKAPRRRSSC